MVQGNGLIVAAPELPQARGEQMMITLTESEIREDLLTLEDAALLVDSNGDVPHETLGRLRDLVRTDPRVMPHFEYLEALADEAGIPETGDRLFVALSCLQEVERLEQTEDWQHPAEILDPTGDLGVDYPELIRLAAMRLRQEGDAGRYRSVKRKLERAWSAEKVSDALAESFAARLCEYEPVEAERLLRHAERRYQVQRRRAGQAPR